MEGFRYIAIGMMSLGLFASAFGVAKIFSSAFEGIARNPEAEPKIAKYIFVGAGLTEAMGLFALVVIFLLMFVV